MQLENVMVCLFMQGHADPHLSRKKDSLASPHAFFTIALKILSNLLDRALSPACIGKYVAASESKSEARFDFFCQFLRKSGFLYLSTTPQKQKGIV